MRAADFWLDLLLVLLVTGAVAFGLLWALLCNAHDTRKKDQP